MDAVAVKTNKFGGGGEKKEVLTLNFSESSRC